MKTYEEHLSDAARSLNLAISDLFEEQMKYIQTIPNQKQHNCVEKEFDALGNSRLYPVAKAAEVLGVSPDYVYDRINEGIIRVVELGTGRAKQRVRADDLQRFIDERTFGGK